VREALEPFDRTLDPVWQHREAQLAPEPARRGVIRGFSQRSRRRLAKSCAAIPWGATPFYFVTLTYPAEWSTDGKRIKADLNQFRTEWSRRFGLPLAVWKLEFQRRGAPHFHLAIAQPDGVSMEVLRYWVGHTWNRIAGDGDVDHLRVALHPKTVEVMVKPPSAYFSSHGEHGRDSKGYQNEVPDGFEDVGRFWGFWNLAPDWNEYELSLDEFVAVRRMMRRWRKATTGRKYRQMRPYQGMWLRTPRRPSLHFALQLLQAVKT
jgi:hypothetical protein